MRAKFPWIESMDMKESRKRRSESTRITEEGEKLVGGSKGKGEEGNGLYQTGRWSTFRFFSPSFCNHLSNSPSSLPVRGPSLIVFHSFLRPFHFVTV